MDDDTRRPKDRAAWDQRYVEGALPWDTGRPDPHLARVLAGHGVEPGRALEVGCGTGTNVVWLARRGFDVTGVDLSEVAIAKAKAKTAASRLDCQLLAADFLADPVPGAPFDFVYDRHSHARAWILVARRRKP